MAEQQYRILDHVPPTSRSTEQENRFVLFYDETCRKFRFEDVFTMIEDPMWRDTFIELEESSLTPLQFPATVELEVPWCSKTQSLLSHSRFEPACS